MVAFRQWRSAALAGFFVGFPLAFDNDSREAGGSVAAGFVPSRGDAAASRTPQLDIARHRRNDAEPAGSHQEVARTGAGMVSISRISSTAVAVGDHAIRLCPTGARFPKPPPAADASAAFDSFDLFGRAG